MTLDLATLSVAEETWVEIEHPSTAEPVGIQIKVAGSDSEIYKKQMRKQQDKRLKRGFRKVNSEQLETEGRELLVACTLDWKGVVYNGEELECNAENVRWLYKTYSWIKDQVDNAIGDVSNFLGE